MGMFVAVGFFFRINSLGIHPVVGRTNQISRDVMGDVMGRFFVSFIGW